MDSLKNLQMSLTRFATAVFRPTGTQTVWSQSGHNGTAYLVLSARFHSFMITASCVDLHELIGLMDHKGNGVWVPSEGEGRRFESCLARQFFPWLINALSMVILPR